MDLSIQLSDCITGLEKFQQANEVERRKLLTRVEILELRFSRLKRAK